MGMDMSSGNIRELKVASDLKDGEVLFTEGETVEVKGCSFEIVGIASFPFNEITLRGKAKAFNPIGD